jgi:hypothetical protein
VDEEDPGALRVDCPQHWRFLAEEHGACLCDFLEVDAQPRLIYEQAVIAAHFGRLYLAARATQ